MIAFETEVRIRRPAEEVFAYVAEPLNFPQWNSAVQAVRKTSGRESEAGSTPFHYRFRFAPQGGATAIHLDAEAELGGAGAAFAPVVRRALRNGVDENLARVKAILEAAESADRTASAGRLEQIEPGGL